VVFVKTFTKLGIRDCLIEKRRRLIRDSAGIALLAAVVGWSRRRSMQHSTASTVLLRYFSNARSTVHPTRNSASWDTIFPHKRSDFSGVTDTIVDDWSPIRSRPSRRIATTYASRTIGFLWSFYSRVEPASDWWRNRFMTSNGYVGIGFTRLRAITNTKPTSRNCETNCRRTAAKLSKDMASGGKMAPNRN